MGKRTKIGIVIAAIGIAIACSSGGADAPVGTVDSVCNHLGDVKSGATGTWRCVDTGDGWHWKKTG